MDPLEIDDQFTKYADVASHLVVDGMLGECPRLSIMIPTYRRPGLLKEALCSALAQITDVPFEVVVIDNDATMDGEVDRVVAGFNSHKLRLFRNSENIGMFGNWNRCIELARGEWISILNDDDLLKNNFIEEMFSVINKNSSIGLLFCRSEFKDERGGRAKRNFSLFKQKIKTLNSCFLSSKIDLITANKVYLDSLCSSLGMIYRREFAIKIGGFKESQFPISDYVFFVMYVLRYPAYRLNRCLAFYRIHKNESANPTTGEGFIVKNIELRKSMEKYVIAPVSLLKAYAKLYALKTISHYRYFWTVNLDSERFRHDHDLPFISPVPWFFLVRNLLRIIFFVSDSLIKYHP